MPFLVGVAATGGSVCREREPLSDRDRSDLVPPTSDGLFDGDPECFDSETPSEPSDRAMDRRRSRFSEVRRAFLAGLGLEGESTPGGASLDSLSRGETGGDNDDPARDRGDDPRLEE